MNFLLPGLLASGTLAAAATSRWGAAWMSQSVQVPVGWLVVGALVLTFVPTLSLIAVVQRKLGVEVEVTDT